MHRVSIRRIMGVVVILSVILAAMHSASGLWSGIMLLIAAVSVGTGIIGSISGSGIARHESIGFTVFAGGYLLLVFVDADTGHLMPTTYVLEYISSRATQPDPELEGLESRRAKLTRLIALDREILGENSSLSKSMAGDIAVLEDTIRARKRSRDYLNAYRWKALIPGAAHFDSFLRIGHCAFALLAGLLGSFIARQFRRRDPERLQNPRP